MKLKDGIVTHFNGEDYIAIATGEAGKIFNGLIRNNKTADYLFQQLKTDQSEEDLVKALLARYDVSEQEACKDVRKFLAVLQEAGLLDE